MHTCIDTDHNKEADNYTNYIVYFAENKTEINKHLVIMYIHSMGGIRAKGGLPYIDLIE